MDGTSEALVVNLFVITRCSVCLMKIQEQKIDPERRSVYPDLDPDCGVIYSGQGEKGGEQQPRKKEAESTAATTSGR